MGLGAATSTGFGLGVVTTGKGAGAGGVGFAAGAGGVIGGRGPRAGLAASAEPANVMNRSAVRTIRLV